MKRWWEFLQEFTFVHLFYLWVSIGMTFAVVYYLLNILFKDSLLYLNNPLSHSFLDFLTIVYFSFITLTSTGYGDVVPLGVAKILSIIEIFCGLVVFGFLISKLISPKQQKILEELYELSFEEKVNRMRSSLYVYRANISRTIDKIILTRKVQNADINNLETNLEGLKSGINRIRRFLLSKDKKSITKIDDLNLNLLFNSVSLSISKILEILNLLNEKKYDWQRKIVVKHVASCIESVRELQELYDKKSLKDELKSLLKAISENLTKLEGFIK